MLSVGTVAVLVREVVGAVVSPVLCQVPALLFLYVSVPGAGRVPDPVKVPVVVPAGWFGWSRSPAPTLLVPGLVLPLPVLVVLVALAGRCWWRRWWRVLEASPLGRLGPGPCGGGGGGAAGAADAPTAVPVSANALVIVMLACPRLPVPSPAVPGTARGPTRALMLAAPTKDGDAEDGPDVPAPPAGPAAPAPPDAPESGSAGGPPSLLGTSAATLPAADAVAVASAVAGASAAGAWSPAPPSHCRAFCISLAALRYCAFVETLVSICICWTWVL